ncbi:unnamed protein product, partial [Iphiclides podalirius]
MEARRDILNLAGIGKGHKSCRSGRLLNHLARRGSTPRATSVRHVLRHPPAPRGPRFAPQRGSSPPCRATRATSASVLPRQRGASGAPRTAPHDVDVFGHAILREIDNGPTLLHDVRAVSNLNSRRLRDASAASAAPDLMNREGGPPGGVAGGDRTAASSARISDARVAPYIGT